MNPIDITGKTFGRLTVLREASNRIRRQLAWVCRCTCGKEVTAPSYDLRSGNTSSCGCLRQELTVARLRARARHGEADKTPEYRAWANMLSRCRNPNHSLFKHYGARGISVCERWLTYENFLADVGRRPSKFYSLDRINNEGNYKPGNVRWATSVEQNNNTRGNRYLTLRGETRPFAEWLELAKCTRARFYLRIRRGMSEEDALFDPPRHRTGKPLSECKQRVPST